MLLRRRKNRAFQLLFMEIVVHDPAAANQHHRHAPCTAEERSRCCRLHGVTEKGVPPRPSAAKHRLVATMSLCSQRRGKRRALPDCRRSSDGEEYCHHLPPCPPLQPCSPRIKMGATLAAAAGGELRSCRRCEGQGKRTRIGDREVSPVSFFRESLPRATAAAALAPPPEPIIVVFVFIGGEETPADALRHSPTEEGMPPCRPPPCPAASCSLRTGEGVPPLVAGKTMTQRAPRRCRRQGRTADAELRTPSPVANSMRLAGATMPLLFHAPSSVAEEKEGQRGVARVEDCRRSPMAAA
nr:hypothetical protein Iba_chr09aCG13360 [Ipomoea batatas]